MSEEQKENERRFGRIAGIAGLFGLLVFIGAGLLNLAPDYNGSDGLAEQLGEFADEKSGVLAQAVIQTIAIGFFAFPLVALFRSAAARSDAVRPTLIGAVIAGPLIFAASVLALYFAVDAAVHPFLNGGPDIDTSSNDDASDVFGDQGAASIYIGLAIAGRLGLVFGMAYTSLHAMRTGLFTRFWGTLGMALGVGLFFIGPQALLIFTLAASLMVADLWPRGRPPAWDAGVAMPWPKPGETISTPAADAGEDVASPEDFEGSATEVTASPGRPGRRDNKRKRKRKAR
jgi:hypothetical protein